MALNETLTKDNKLSSDQRFIELSWAKSRCQTFTGKEQEKYEYERVKINNCNTIKIE